MSPYKTTYGASGEAEQDPAGYLEAARRAIADCGGPPPSGIGLAGQTPTLVLVGPDAEPVRPALTWQDHRAHAEAKVLAEDLGAAEPWFGTNLPWTAAYPPAKLLWLARNEPDTVLRTRWALQPKDFVGLRLTGSPLSDPWSSKGLCNVQTKAAAEKPLSRTGWSPGVSPPLAQAWEPRGTVNAAGAAAFGVPRGTPVAVGWSDALAAMFAVGAFEEPTGFVLTGTSSIVGVSTAGPIAGDFRLLEIPATCAPLAVSYGPTESAGGSLHWLARLLGCDIETALALAASPAARSDIPMFVPYLAGERAPIWRTDVRGALLGLSAQDGAKEIAHAVVMGVCLSECDVLSLAEQHTSTTAAEVRVAGRGASQPPWLGARLAALGRPLRLLGEPDASALGAAMLAAAAANGGDLAAARPLSGQRRRHDSHPGAREAVPQRLQAYRRAARTTVSQSQRVTGYETTPIDRTDDQASQDR